VAYPQTPLPVVVEIYLGASLGWVDITDYVLVRGGIYGRRGFPDEGTIPEPGSMHFELNNRDGRFTPKNPTGPYYGLIGRNTPLRVRLTGDVAGEPYMAIESVNFNSTVHANDHASLDITGDIDIRVDVAMDTWAGTGLHSKYETDGDQRSWLFTVDSSGNLSLAWSTDGTSGGELSATSTTTAGLVDGQRKAVRATLDVNDGGGNHVVTFYTADTLNDTWVQLGSPVITAGTTSIYSSTAPLDVGHAEALLDQPTGKVYAFELRDGIGGTVVADPDFTSQSADIVFFTDGTGKGWLITGDARIHDPGIRGIYEVSEWPSRWDVSGQDVWVPVVAQGVLRRLGQGRQRAKSPLRGTLEYQSAQLAGYWPMESSDWVQAGTSFSSAFSDGSAMTITGAAPDVGDAGIGPLLGSDKIPVLAATTRLRGVCRDLQFDGETTVAASVILDVPAVTGWTNNTAILHVEQSTSGSTVATWEVRYKTGGDLELRALNAAGSELATSGTITAGIDGEQVWLHFYVTQSGSDAGWRVDTATVDEDGVTLVETAAAGTFAGLTVARATAVAVAPSGGLAELAVGHVAVSTTFGFGTSANAGDEISSAVVSHASERAATRAERLTAEAEVPFRIVGIDDDADDTNQMGPQAIPSTFFDAYHETWAADASLSFETRHQLGLTFRTLGSLYNQTAAFTLDYTAAGEIAPDLEPTDDDQHVRNDVEVRRTNGSFARAVDSTSRMGTQDPPDGVGRYEHSVTLNLYDDAILTQVAGWLLHVGTWDEARYPRIRINLLALAAQGKWPLLAAAAALDVGDRITLTNMPSWLPPGDVDLMVLGFEESFGAFSWDIVLNCVPYGPYRVQQLTDDPPADDVLDGWAIPDVFAPRAAFDDNDTSWTVDCWPRMTTDADDMPCRITVAGEECAITAVATTAATFIAVGAADHDDNAAVTPGDYAGGAVDDWIVVVAGSRDTSSPTLAISDANYTFEELVPHQGGLYVWAAVRTASTPAPTITPTGGAAGDTVSAQIFGLRGMPITGSPSDWVLASTGKTNSSAQNIAFGRIPAGGYAGRVILLLARKSDDWTSATVSGLLEISEPTSTSGNDQSLYLARRIDTIPTVVTGSSITATGGTTAVSDSLVIALQGGYQTLTLTRAVNGVTKSQVAGDDIELLDAIVASL
jgi:hypothetical protein